MTREAAVDAELVGQRFAIPGMQLNTDGGVVWGQLGNTPLCVFNPQQNQIQAGSYGVGGAWSFDTWAAQVMANP
jgi:hypothetical protein